MGNIKLTPNANSLCKPDVKSFCEDVEPGNGRVHECLLKHKKEISLPCNIAEFHLQALGAIDITLNPVVRKACKSSIEKLCPNMVAGHGRIWSCLEQHKGKPGM